MASIHCNDERDPFAPHRGRTSIRRRTTRADIHPVSADSYGASMLTPQKPHTRRLAAGAIVGPAAFIASWVIGGVVLDGYDPLRDAISRLAAVGAPTAPILNGGLVAYGLGVGVAALALRRTIGRWSAGALAINALLTFGVLATPLDRSPSVDQLHSVFAGGAYVALAAASLLAAHEFRKRDSGRASRISAVVGAITAASLLATSLGEFSGLFQRLGLTISDLWMMGIAVWMFRQSDSPSGHATVRSM